MTVASVTPERATPERSGPPRRTLLGLALLVVLLHLALLLGLCAVLGGKARREERFLLQLHPGYRDYRRSTPAIVPGVPWLDWRS